MMWSDRDELFDLFPVTYNSIRWHRYNEHRRIDRYYKLIPEDIYLEFFKLLTTREHWYASDWATRARKWLGDGVSAHLDNNPQTTRYVLTLDEKDMDEEQQDRRMIINKTKKSPVLIQALPSGPGIA